MVIKSRSHKIKIIFYGVLNNESSYNFSVDVVALNL